MKRFLFLSMIAVFGFCYTSDATSVADVGKAVISVADSAATAVSNGVAFVDTSSLYKQIYTDVKYGLAGIADGLKVGVEHVYTVLVKQQVVKSITNLIVLLFFALILKYSIKPMYTWASEHSRASDGGSWAMVVLLWCVMSLPIVNEIFSMQETVMGFINPEYGAIMQIMDWAKHAVR
jgi:hypothetical protein